MTYVVTLTGHRPNKLGGFNSRNPLQMRLRNALSEKLQSAVSHHDDVVVISGLALGWDTWGALECMRLNIPFVGAAPCRAQESRWPTSAQQTYRRLCEAASVEHAIALNENGPGDVLTREGGVVFVHDGTYPGPWCMQARNIWMVDRANAVLSCFDGSSGGTANCVEYARGHGVPVLNIDPVDHHPKVLA